MKNLKARISKVTTLLGILLVLLIVPATEVKASTGMAVTTTVGYRYRRYTLDRSEFYNYIVNRLRNELSYDTIPAYTNDGSEMNRQYTKIFYELKAYNIYSIDNVDQYWLASRIDQAYKSYKSTANWYYLGFGFIFFAVLICAASRFD